MVELQLREEKTGCWLPGKKPGAGTKLRAGRSRPWGRSRAQGRPAPLLPHPRSGRLHHGYKAAMSPGGPPRFPLLLNKLGVSAQDGEGEGYKEEGDLAVHGYREGYPPQQYVLFFQNFYT